MRKSQREDKKLIEMTKFFSKSDNMAGGLTIKATGISGLRVPSEIQYEKPKVFSK